MRAATTISPGPRSTSMRRPSGRLDSHNRWTERGGLDTYTWIGNTQTSDATGHWTSQSTNVLNRDQNYDYDHAGRRPIHRRQRRPATTSAPPVTDGFDTNSNRTKPHQRRLPTPPLVPAKPAPRKAARPPATLALTGRSCPAPAATPRLRTVPPSYLRP